MLIFKKIELEITTRDSVLRPNDIRSDIDVSPESNTVGIICFQSLIGMLRWIVKLKRTYMACKASIMMSFMVISRQDHLDLFSVYLLLFKITIAWR